jgi:hypothetical protein
VNANLNLANKKLPEYINLNGIELNLISINEKYVVGQIDSLKQLVVFEQSNPIY